MHCGPVQHHCAALLWAHRARAVEPVCGGSGENPQALPRYWEYLARQNARAGPREAPRAPEARPEAQPARRGLGSPRIGDLTPIRPAVRGEVRDVAVVARTLGSGRVIDVMA
jgi:hypothetical protein